MRLLRKPQSPRCARLRTLAFLTAVYAGAASAQAPPETFAESVNVELVNVEVWVTDRDGNAVTGLNVDDFEVDEDGKPVKISYFDELRGMGVRDLSLEPADRSTPPAAEAEAVEELGTPGYLVLYFDETFLGATGRKRMIQDLRDFVEAQLVAPERILILRQEADLTVVTPLGSSRADLDAALAQLVTPSTRGLQNAADEKRALRRLQEKWEEITDSPVSRGSDPCERFVLEGPRIVQPYANMIEGRVSETLAHLTDTASFLAGLPGLKALVYVSDGLTTTPGTNLLDYVKAACPGVQGESRLDYRMGMSGVFRRLTRHANANRVTVYPIQALGLRTQLSLSGAENRSVRNLDRAANRYEAASRTQQREGMSFLAAETGGRATFNQGKFLQALEQVYEDMSGYYSLAYAPPHGGDGLEHEIKVRVRKSAGSGLRVRHRPGYRDKSADQRMAERLESTLFLNVMANPLDVRLGAGEVRAVEGGKYAVPFHILIPTPRITFLPQHGGEVARFKVQVMAQDEHRRRSAFAQKVYQVPRPEAANQLISLTLGLELDGGVHVVAFGVLDEASQETSFVSTTIDLRPATGASADGG